MNFVTPKALALLKISIELQGQTFTYVPHGFFFRLVYNLRVWIDSGRFRLYS
jgi:hypothetical protein